MSTHVLVRDPEHTRLWAIARGSAMVALVGLLAWLFLAPAGALTTLWYVAIPLLPATFFISTIPWRSVCPLATLNAWGNGIGHQRTLSPRATAVLSVTGLVLFHLMVPARRFLFNTNGPVLAVTVLAVGALALVLGSIYSVRSAFCNALCPVLPVELLYGQAPMIRLNRGRCETCTTCTPRGCLDLAQGRAFNQVVGAGRDIGWLARPFGVFIAALPGFIIGYGLTSDGPLASAPTVYLTTLGWSAGSVLFVAASIIVTGLNARTSQIVIAALAGLAYYWFAGTAIARELGAGTVLATSIRVLGMGLVLFWLIRTLRDGGRNGASNGVKRVTLS